MYHNIITLNAKASSVDLTALILRHWRNLRSLLGRRKGKQREKTPGCTRLPTGSTERIKWSIQGLSFIAALSTAALSHGHRRNIRGSCDARDSDMRNALYIHVHLDMCDMKTTRSTHETTSYLLNLRSPTEDANKSQHNKQ